MLEFAQAARAAIHVEATGRTHTTSRKRLQGGHGARVAVRREGEGLPSTRTAVKVAICEYGAGNVRSVALALGRLGAELVDDVAGADSPCCPGRSL
jgi:hypothetical protein